MKHLKLFKESKNPMYVEISTSDAGRLLSNKDYNSSFSKKISERYPRWNFEDVNSGGIICRTFSPTWISIWINIIFLKDEWFLVGIYFTNDTSYYKCDQLQGVFELLDKCYRMYK